jgi:energy-coupling factor transport system substrate-specific component
MMNERTARTTQQYWEVRELVVIGIFAAITKVSSLLVALAGGGMNPLSLMLKNVVFTALIIVLLFKIRKFGALTLFMVVGAVFSMLLMGGGFFMLPVMVLAGLVAEGCIVLLGGYDTNRNIVLGVAIYDIVSKLLAVGVSYLYVREQPQMLIVTGIMVGIGYIGAIAGLFVGTAFVKELRHAGIVRA